MSWQANVDKLIKTNHCYAAAILGLEGKIYATSKDLALAPREHEISNEKGGKDKVTIDEAKQLIEAVNNAGTPKNSSCLYLNGEKYLLTTWRPEDNVGYYKILNGGATVVKTGKTVIVGLWSGAKVPGQNGGNCNKVVEKLAADFIKVKY